MVGRVTVAEAAKRMGKSQLFVREAMKRGLLDIGTALKMPGSTKWTFHISPAKLEMYLGGNQECTTAPTAARS